MAKKFCTTGTCIPEKNYMVDLSNRIQQIINQYIESGQYFTINRARQYGKTTLLYLLEKELRKQDYLVLSLSFEAADEYFESLGSLAEGLSLDIEECLREQNVDEKVLEEWNHSISERQYVMTPKFVGSWIYLYTMNWKLTMVTGITAYKLEVII